MLIREFTAGIAAERSSEECKRQGRLFGRRPWRRRASWGEL